MPAGKSGFICTCGKKWVAIKVPNKDRTGKEIHWMWDNVKQDRYFPAT